MFSLLLSFLASSFLVEIACCVINVRSNLEFGSVGNLWKFLYFTGKGQVRYLNK
jgi:hypothetical protein